MPVAQRLKHRFGIERVCIVADRGMISQETIEQLDKLKWQYILGVRMRRVKEIGEKCSPMNTAIMSSIPRARKAVTLRR